MKSETSNPQDVASQYFAKANQWLEEYKFVGQDHPAYIHLQEAISRRNQEETEKAIKELETIKTASKKNNPAPQYNPRMPWGLVVLWSIWATAALMSIGMRMIQNKNKEAIEPPLLYAGHLTTTPDSIIKDIQQSLEATQPDYIYYIGYQLAKADLVRALHQWSQKAEVSVVLGSHPNQTHQLAHPQSPLYRFSFTRLLYLPKIQRTQVLIAINQKRREGFAMIGSFPCDQQEASQGEYLMVITQSYRDCLRLLGYYHPLLNQASKAPYVNK